MTITLLKSTHDVKTNSVQPRFPKKNKAKKGLKNKFISLIKGFKLKISRLFPIIYAKSNKAKQKPDLEQKVDVLKQKPALEKKTAIAKQKSTLEEKTVVNKSKSRKKTEKRSNNPNAKISKARSAASKLKI